MENNKETIINGNVKRVDFYYPSRDQKTRIHAIRWEPVNNAKIRGVIQIVHGMAEYIERYQDFAIYLCGRNFIVTGEDHLGHGESVTSKKDYGYFAKNNGDRVIIKDMNNLLKATKKRYSLVPYILMGHSMGSYMVRQFLCICGDTIDAAILCGTGYVPEAKIKLGLGVTYSMSRVFGWHFRSRFVTLQMFAGYNDRIEKKESMYDWVTSDDEMRKKYLEDERCGFLFTLNGYYNFMMIMKSLLNQKNIEKMNKTLPVLFTSGSEDPVGGFSEGVKMVIRQFEDAGMHNISSKFYPGCRHEIINDVCRDEAYADIADWIIRVTE